MHRNRANRVLSAPLYSQAVVYGGVQPGSSINDADDEANNEPNPTPLQLIRFSELDLLRNALTFNQEYPRRELEPCHSIFSNACTQKSNSRRKGCLKFNDYQVHCLTLSCHLVCQTRFRKDKIKNVPIWILETALLIMYVAAIILTYSFPPPGLYWIPANLLKMFSGENDQIDRSCSTVPPICFLAPSNLTANQTAPDCFDDCLYTNFGRLLLFVFMAYPVYYVQSWFGSCANPVSLRDRKTALKTYISDPSFRSQLERLVARSENRTTSAESKDDMKKLLTQEIEVLEGNLAEQQDTIMGRR